MVVSVDEVNISAIDEVDGVDEVDPWFTVVAASAAAAVDVTTADVDSSLVVSSVVDVDVDVGNSDVVENVVERMLSKVVDVTSLLSKVTFST